MRFVRSLACAAVAVKAANEYDDDDLQFAVRMLQSNSSSTNGTSSGTTTETTTTTVAAATTTGAATLNPTQAPVTRPASATVNDSNANATTEFIVTSEVSVEPPFTPPTFTASSRLRRLSGHMHRAYNLFCAAFSLTQGLVTCKALQAAGQIAPATDSATVANNKYVAGTVLYPNLDYCQVKIAAHVAGTNCADTTASSKGSCVTNMPSTGMTEHKGCTVHEAISGSSSYKYKTETKLTLRGTVPAATTANLNTAKATTSTNMGSSATTANLQAYLVVAAVQMRADPAIAAAVNFTEAFGLSDAQLTAAYNAIQAGGVTSVVETPPAAITAAINAVKAANPTYSSPTVTSTTPAAGTSGAVQVTFGVVSSMLLVFSALFM